MSLSIAELFNPATADEFYAKFLAAAAIEGLAPGTWPDLGMAKKFMYGLADLCGVPPGHVDLLTAGVSMDLLASLIARSGFLDSAAEITVDGSFGFLDLLTDSLYDERRTLATRAAGPVVMTNAGGIARGPFQVGAYHLVNATLKKTYSNSEVFSLPLGSDTTVQFRADEAGAASTTVANLLTPVTSLIGVTVKTSGGANTNTLLGSNTQTNASLVSTSRGGLQALGPKLGPSGAFVYFATDATLTGYPVLAGGQVTRAVVSTDPLTGVVHVYLANSAGALSGPDVTLVATWLQSVVNPDAGTMSASAATVHNADVHLDVYVPTAKAGVAVTDVRAAISLYFQGLALGGFNGLLPRGQLIAAINSSVTYVENITNLTIDGSSSDVALLFSDVVAQSPATTVTVHAV